MKLVKIIISMALLLLLGYGWLTTGVTALQFGSVYSEHVKKGDQSFEKKLYEDAYENYTNALGYKKSKELVDKQILAYTNYYVEEANGNYSERAKLIEILNDATKLYPDVVEYAIQKIGLELESGDYQAAKKTSDKYIEKNQDNEELLAYRKQIISTVTKNYDHYIDFKFSNSGLISVDKGQDWRIIDKENRDSSKGFYEMMGPIGENDLFVAKEAGFDVRIYDLKEIARGLTKLSCTEAGMYHDGLCPVKSGEDWYYIDTNGDTVLGPFRYAGTFQDGKAAVQDQNQSWYIIDIDGNAVSETFADIRLNCYGYYLNNDIVVAAEKEGKYQIYDKDMNLVSNTEFENADAAVDGLIAVETGNLWGFADAEGNIVIPAEYENAKSFSNGLAAVCINQRWGYIKTDKTIALANEYLDASYVNNEGCTMVSDEEGSYIMVRFEFLKELVKQ